RVGDRARAEGAERPAAVAMVADAVKAGAILFVAALVQVTVLNRLRIFGGGPDLLLLALVGVSLLRGSVFGAAGGFCAGLPVDPAEPRAVGARLRALPAPPAAAGARRARDGGAAAWLARPRPQTDAAHRPPSPTRRAWSAASGRGSRSWASSSSPSSACSSS